ncbi:TIGR02646 family protein [Dickeya oryzae]|uniref:TIGR02646 family protein n=1 Tax=Dickeya oryzae TaxID=1240404 RepID=A0AB39IUR3_9GAMM|nr:TIGR02646 family protein [Dickeya oryzae]MCA6990416.1 TIGR02646 family protein [Dickeya oryzae]
MRKITKGTEPASLTAWKRANPNGRYDNLTETERQDIRDACVKEQFGLCAYCCKPISGDNSDTMNEHVQARDEAPQRSLDFTNIVASCTTPNQCDAAHGSQAFSLTPLMAECETELEFMSSGRVKGKTERAQEAIKVLNLGDHETNNKKLIGARRKVIHDLLWKEGINPEEKLELEDDDLLRDLLRDFQIDNINKYSTPQNGRLEQYSPVLVNFLKGWLPT